MGLLSKKNSIDAKEIAKQAANLEAQAKRLEEANKAFMKGRSIAKAEKEIEQELKAVNSVRESLKQDADKIKLEAAEELDKAKRGVADAKAKLKVLDEREADLNDREKAISEEEGNIKAFKIQLTNQLESAKAAEKAHNAEVKRLQEGLKALLNG